MQVKLNLMAGLVCFLLGGIQTVYAQFAKTERPYVEMLVTTNHSDRTYKAGESAVVTVEAYAGGNPLNTVYVHYSLGADMQPADKKDSVLFRNGKAEIPVGTSLQPGFRYCKLDFKVEGKVYKEFLKVAYAPSDIKPYTELPSDFNRFWQKALRASAKLALKPEVTLLPKYSTDSINVYLVKLNISKSGRCLYGYLAKPKAAGKYPVLFTPPGAGSKRILPILDYAKQGFISLNIEIHGLNPELPEAVYNKERTTKSDYYYRGIASRDTYYYKDVYIGCVRAVDYLCSLPEFDGRHVAVTGGSQGGALTIVTAALNPKVTCLTAFYPALSDLSGFLEGRAGGWPKFFSSEAANRKLSGVSPDVAVKTLAYYDVVNFARQLKVPGFYSFGYCDETCSPTSVWSVMNSITAPKTIVITPTSGHWRFPATNQASVNWLKAND